MQDYATLHFAGLVVGISIGGASKIDSKCFTESIWINWLWSLDNLTTGFAVCISSNIILSFIAVVDS